MRAPLLLVLAVALLAFTSVVSANIIDSKFHAVKIEEPQARDPQHMAEMAQEIGLSEISAAADAAAEARENAEEAADAAEAAADEHAAMLETADAPVAEAASVNFVFEDDNQHVLVEAQSESGISTMKQPKAKKASTKKTQAKAAKKTQAAPLSASAAELKKPKEVLFNSMPTNAKELLVLAKPAAPGELPLANTFPAGITPQAAPESAAVVNKRLDLAKRSLARLAHAEHVQEHKDYKHALHKWQYARQVEKSRQSKKFERALPPETPRLPSASSNGAVMNGDRNHNTLFPAATAKSDGKAPSQNHDFHHRGNGDLYYDHLNLVEHSSDASEAAAADDAAATDDAAAADATTDDAAAAIADADTQDAAAAAAAAAAEAEARAPTLVKEPCADQCDVAGGWKTAACQDCIVRGMVNGWIVKSIQDQQKGYNYIHWARNKCVRYANELHLRSSEVKGAPFAHCFFQKVHETCNL